MKKYSRKRTANDVCYTGLWWIRK